MDDPAPTPPRDADPPPRRDIPPPRPLDHGDAVFIGFLAGITDFCIVMAPMSVILLIVGQGVLLLTILSFVWPLALFFPVFGVLRGLHHKDKHATGWALYRTCKSDLYRVGDIADPFAPRRGLGMRYMLHLGAGLLVAALGMAIWMAPLWLPLVFK